MCKPNKSVSSGMKVSRYDIASAERAQCCGEGVEEAEDVVYGTKEREYHEPETSRLRSNFGDGPSWCYTVLVTRIDSFCGCSIM